MNYTLMRFPDFRYKAVTLSYDDNAVYDKTLAALLDKYGMKCTFNLNSERFAKTSGGRMMTEGEAIGLLKNSVHEVAVHGEDHLSLAELDRAAACKEVLFDRINLERIFNAVIKGMAYANGSYDDKVIEVLKSAGIKYARTVKASHSFNIPSDWLRLAPTCHHGDSELASLMKEFLKDYEENDHYLHKKPKLFYLWGHASEFNDHNEWHIIQEFCDTVGNRSDVWYATNGEIYDYVKAFENLEYSVSGKIINNPTALDLYIVHRGKEIKVPSGKTVYISEKE